jgi:glycerol-3-phosphate dehydrogenase subunit B
MPRADVVVVGSGLAGLTCALSLAEGGARVLVVAAGHAAGHWTGGPLDVAAPRGAGTSRAGLAALAALPGHPYQALADEVDPALGWLGERLAAGGLPYVGDLDTPLRPVPTGLGATRPAAIVPAALAAALPPWGPDERLLVVGFEGFKDLWPEAVAAGLRRAAVWDPADRPAAVQAVRVQVPALSARRSLDANIAAALFDQAAVRGGLIAAITRAVDRLPGGPARIALPAVLGLHDHAAVLEEAARRLPYPVFELPLVPPSIPGLRMAAVLREAVRRGGGRMQIGEPVARVEREDGRVRRVVLPAAARELVIETERIVLATGGIAGGGLLATAEGRLRETVMDLPVEAPSVEAWLAQDPFDPAGHPLEGAGIRVDAQLRPRAPLSGPTSRKPTPDGQHVDGVHVCGSLLAGQRYLRQRCGDGVALASARRAARVVLGTPMAAGVAR